MIALKLFLAIFCIFFKKFEVVEILINNNQKNSTSGGWTLYGLKKNL